jgi:hypothetical protein
MNGQIFAGVGNYTSRREKYPKPTSDTNAEPMRDQAINLPCTRMS